MLNLDDLNKYINALLNKSEEAYLMSIEIINKPTINYRTEGFFVSLFVMLGNYYLKHI